MKEVDDLAQILWDYMHMNHTIVPSDCILVFGTHHMSPAIRGCELFMQSYAKNIIFSGGYGDTQKFEKSEAEMYADYAYSLGIPKECIYIENRSRNTGENVKFSKELIEKENIPHNRIILVHKPYMERRAYATFKAVWPEQDILVTSQNISYIEYATNNPFNTKETVINRIVVDFQKIKEYAKLGFQIEQDIPANVWDAYEKLVSLGYDKHVIN